MTTNEPETLPEPSIEAEETGAAGAPASFESLFDVSMPLIVEIGRASMTVSELLQLGVGSVFPLERAVGEPVDVYVSDRKLAEGEIVVVGENLGVRITRVLSHQGAAS